MRRIAIIRPLPRHRGREAAKMDGTAASPAPTEIIHVDDRIVACDGGDSALGPSARVPAHRGPIRDVPLLLAPLCA